MVWKGRFGKKISSFLFLFLNVDWKLCNNEGKVKSIRYNKKWMILSCEEYEKYQVVAKRNMVRSTIHVWSGTWYEYSLHFS